MIRTVSLPKLGKPLRAMRIVDNGTVYVTELQGMENSFIPSRGIRLDHLKLNFPMLRYRLTMLYLK